MVPERARAVEGLDAVEDAGEGGLARAVLPDEGDLVAALDVERSGAVEDADLAVGRGIAFREGREFEHHAARAPGLGETDRDGGLVGGRRREALHLFEHLDAALHLPRLRGLVPEALDEPLRLGDLFLLIEVGGPLDLPAFLPFLEVEGIVARVLGDLPVRELGDGGHHAVEEIAVVRDDDDRAGIAFEVAFEPVDAVDVEVVRGLVEEEDVGAAEEESGEGHAHAPSAGEGGEGAVEVVGVEAEAAEDGLRAGPHEVHLPRDELGVDAVEGVEEPVVLRALVVGLGLHGAREAFLLALEGEHVFECHHRLFEHAPFGDALLYVLCEISERCVARHDRALVRRLPPGDDAEQRGLARAVGPDEADAPVEPNGPRQTVEDGLAAEGERDVVQLDQERVRGGERETGVG